MEKFEVEAAFLHSDVILPAGGGTHLILNAQKTPDVEMVYDIDRKVVLLKYKDKKGKIYRCAFPDTQLKIVWLKEETSSKASKKVDANS